MLKGDRDGQRVNALGQGIYSTHKYSVLELNSSFQHGVWFELVWWGQGQNYSLRPLIWTLGQFSGLWLMISSANQVVQMGRGQYGDRWRSMCTVFNNVKPCHTVSQGKWQEDQEAECNFPTTMSDTTCWCGFLHLYSSTIRSAACWKDKWLYPTLKED